MKYLIISYKSRNDLYAFSQILKNHGIQHLIINTPNLIASSCMLSIKTDFFNYQHILQILANNKTNSFIGLFVFTSTTRGNQVDRLM